MSTFSEKLQSYIDYAEQETERKVLIRTANNLGLRGMLARFTEDDTHVLVDISPRIQDKAQIEQSIAHEVTHGLLAYGENYCRLKPHTTLNEKDSKSISLLVTMLEDIVVNYRINVAGFQPFSSTYLAEVKRETKSARNKKIDHYAEFEDPVIKDRFMVFRYIMAWGFLEYYELFTQAQKTIARFEKDFRLAYPKQYKMALQIKNEIKKYDIFSAQGYCSILKNCLKLWGLDNLVEIK